MDFRKCWEDLDKPCDGDVESDDDNNVPEHPECGSEHLVRTIQGFECQKCGMEFRIMHQGPTSFAQISSSKTGSAMVVGGKRDQKYGRHVRRKRADAEKTNIINTLRILKELDGKSEGIKIPSGIRLKTAETFAKVCMLITTRGDKRKALIAMVLKMMSLADEDQKFLFTSNDLMQYFGLSEKTLLSLAENILRRLETNKKISIGITKNISEATVSRLLSENFMEKMQLSTEKYLPFILEAIKIFSDNNLHRGSIPNLNTTILSLLNVVAISVGVPGVMNTPSVEKEISASTLRSFEKNMIKKNLSYFKDLFEKFGIAFV